MALDCRIFHPKHFYSDDGQSYGRCRPQGAILAHPYAPLGGCQDDPVIGVVTEALLRKGWIIGTFNFRGAGGSKGRTSWTAKAELADYISFVGFLISYLQDISPDQPGNPSYLRRARSCASLTPIPSTTLPPFHATSDIDQSHGLTMLLGGYSYGSMIASNLPSTDDIVQRFSNAEDGGAEAEIKLRASRLAKQWNEEEAQKRIATLRSEHRLSLDPSRSTSRSIIVGGTESEPGPRRSHDSRRSMDSIRRSFDFSRKSVTRRRRGKSSEPLQTVIPDQPPSALEIQTSYLLISPLLPPLSAFATMFSSIGLANKERDVASLRRNPTLAIYGDEDNFTSAKKLDAWAKTLMQTPQSLFQGRRILGAGHFWREKGVEARLVACIEDFTDGLLPHRLA